MKKLLLITTAMLCGSVLLAQDYWASHTDAGRITTDKAVARLSFPTEFKLFDLNLDPLKQELFRVVGNASRHSTTITVPNANGQLEQFEVFEASNFEPELQARFPEIRAFSGRGITDSSKRIRRIIRCMPYSSHSVNPERFHGPVQPLKPECSMGSMNNCHPMLRAGPAVT
jgi:hypothetical protein